MPGNGRERTALQHVQRLREGRIGSGTRWDRTEARRTRAVLGPRSTQCYQTRRARSIASGRHGGQKFLNALRNTNTSSREYKSWKAAGKANQCFFDGHVEVLSPGDILDDKRQDNYYLPLFGR